MPGPTRDGSLRTPSTTPVAFTVQSNMGGGGEERLTGGDSSSEEDGDETWKAAINSVCGAPANGAATGKTSRSPRREDGGDEREPQLPKHFQIKAQKALNDLLEKTIELVSDPVDSIVEDSVSDETGVRLFKRAPRGIVFDHIDQLEGPKRKPRLAPGEEIDEKSKRFRKQLKSVAVEGKDILAAAEEARRKRLARMEAKEAAKKEAVMKEEQRVAELKRVRGERWLPSIAKQMQLELKTAPKKPAGGLIGKVCTR